MRKLLLGFFIVFSPYLFCQVYHPLPDSNAVWTVGVNLMGLPPINGNFQKYIFSGDTVINYCNYKKISVKKFHNYSFIDSHYMGAIRENNYNWLFIPRYDNTEFLLYNFNTTVGDSVTVYAYKDLYNFEQGLSPTQFKLGVFLIDSILIGNNYRKRITLKDHNNYTERWIQGIGSTDGLFYACSHFCFDCGNLLLCIKQNDSILYYNNYYFDACNDDLDIEDKQNTNEINVYPTIINNGDKIFIKCNENQNLSLNVFDNLGRVILKKNIFSNQNNSVDIPFTGIFIYNIISEDKIIKTGKILICP